MAEEIIEVETRVVPVSYLKDSIREFQVALYCNIAHVEGWSPEFEDFLDQVWDLDDSIYAPESFLEEIRDTVEVYIKDIEFILNGNFTYPKAGKKGEGSRLPMEANAIYSFVNLPGVSMDPDALHVVLKQASDIWVAMNLSLLRLRQLLSDIEIIENREEPEYYIELDAIEA